MQIKSEIVYKIIASVQLLALIALESERELLYSLFAYLNKSKFEKNCKSLIYKDLSQKSKNEVWAIEGEMPC